MPTYDYRCGTCGEVREEFHGINENPRIRCACGGAMKRAPVVCVGIKCGDGHLEQGGFTPHWNQSFGCYVESPQQFKSLRKKWGTEESPPTKEILKEHPIRRETPKPKKDFWVGNAEGARR